MSTTFKDTGLYGGAIHVDLPTTFGDASLIREVPDHQEVWLDQEGYSSIVFDILEHVEKPSDEEALQYHFQDLVADTGDSTNVLLQEKTVMPKTNSTPVTTLSFLQTPQPNPRRKQPEFVSIHLLLLRLKEHGTDIVITVNVPHYPNEYVKASAPGEKTELMKEGDKIAKRILESFEVRDWGLFSP